MTFATVSDPLAELSAAGVSVWLDDLSRELLARGELKELIADRHVVGVTTNPTIFASALSRGTVTASNCAGWHVWERAWTMPSSP